MSCDDLLKLIQDRQNEALEKVLDANPALAQLKNAQGVSLLALSAYYRNPDATRIIRRHRKSIDLYEAAITGDLLAACEQIEKDPSLVHAFTADGFTPLGLSCFFDQLEIARLLIAHGANVNVASRNSFKVAPIHSSCAVSNYRITELLLQHHADPNAVQQEGITPLHEVACHGQEALVQLLLHYGANPQAQSAKGETPLDMALAKNQTGIVAILSPLTKQESTNPT